MENIMSFIKSEKMRNEEQINVANDNLNSCAYQIEEIDNMIIELSKSIDTTYEIFSPNAFDKDSNIIEIEKLKFKKKELEQEIVVLKEKISSLEKIKEKIDISFDEMYDIENQLANNVKNTRYLIDKEVLKVNQNYKKEITKILEMQIVKDSHYLACDIKKKIDNMENKFSLCENFIDMDSNRAKLEIIKLKEELLNIEKKINSEMFHVKHLDDVGIYKSVSEFIKEYQKYVNIKIDFNYSGTRISDTHNNIINLIRVIKEAIDNSYKFSSGNVVSVNIIVDKFESELLNSQDKNENIEYKENNLHQINFTIDNEIKYNINIIITDNGDGFTLQDEKVLNANNLYGISIMKYRAKLLNGNLLIESTPGLGTTVKLIYQISQK